MLGLLTTLVDRVLIFFSKAKRKNQLPSIFFYSVAIHTASQMVLNSAVVDLCDSSDDDDPRPARTAEFELRLARLRTAVLDLDPLDPRSSNTVESSGDGGSGSSRSNLRKGKMRAERRYLVEVPAAWDVDDVTDYLDHEVFSSMYTVGQDQLSIDALAAQLASYMTAFEKGGVDGRTLLAMTPSGLRELGMQCADHRRLVHQHIISLRLRTRNENSSGNNGSSSCSSRDGKISNGDAVIDLDRDLNDSQWEGVPSSALAAGTSSGGASSGGSGAGNRLSAMHNTLILDESFDIVELGVDLSDDDDDDSADLVIVMADGNLDLNTSCGSGGSSSNGRSCNQGTTFSQSHGEMFVAYEMSPRPKQCAMCLDDVEMEKRHALHGCKHEFCQECLVALFHNNIDNCQLPITCPEPDCRREVSLMYDLEVLLDGSSMEKFEQATLDQLIEKNPDEYSCCMTPDCDYVFYFSPGDTQFECPKCGKHYCLQCKVEWHQDSTCKQYQDWAKENGEADNLTMEFIQGSKFKQCPKCVRWVERASGCDYMTCRCGQAFCYRCGKQLPAGPHYCPCWRMTRQQLVPPPRPLQPLAALIHPNHNLHQRQEQPIARPPPHPQPPPQPPSQQQQPRRSRRQRKPVQPFQIVSVSRKRISPLKPQKSRKKQRM